jgi:hypothetical protein
VGRSMAIRSVTRPAPLARCWTMYQRQMPLLPAGGEAKWDSEPAPNSIIKYLAGPSSPKRASPPAFSLAKKAFGLCIDPEYRAGLRSLSSAAVRQHSVTFEGFRPPMTWLLHCFCPVSESLLVWSLGQVSMAGVPGQAKRRRFRFGV